MIGAGKDPTVIQKDTIDTMTTFYCPTGTGEAECKSFLTDAMAKTAGNIPDDAKADEYATSVYFTACSDIYNKCLDGSTKPKAQTCFNNSIRTGSVENDGKAPYGVVYGIEYITFQDYLNRMAEGYGAECDGECIKPLKVKNTALPKVLYDYNVALLANKKDGLGSFASEVRRIFNDAMAMPGVTDADADGVAAAVVDYAKKRIDSIKEMPADKQAEAKKMTQDALARTVVLGVDTAATPDVAVFTAEVPATLWDSAALLAQKQHQRRVFLDALGIYRSKPKAEDLLTASEDEALGALGEAIKKALGDNKDFSKVDVTDVTVDDTGKATAVTIAGLEAGEAVPPAAVAAKAPEAFLTGILGKNADDPHASAAIGEFWKRIVAANAKADTDAGLQKKIIENLFGQLGGLSAFDIAMISVNKVNDDGTVVIDPAPKALIGGDSEATLRTLNVDMALATLERLRQLYDQEMETSDGKAKGKEKVAAEVAKAAMYKIRNNKDGVVAGAQEFFGTTQSTGAAKPDNGFTGHIKTDGATDFDAGGVLLDVEAGNKWDFDGGWYGSLAAGAVLGTNPDALRQELNSNSDGAFLLRKGVDNNKRLLLMKALATVGRERDGEVNYSADIGIDRDDDFLEANKAIARANVEIPVLKKDGKVVTTLAATFGGGWLFDAFNLDPDVEDQSKVGGGFVDIGTGVKADLWKDASAKLSVNYTRAFDEKVADVVSVVGKFKQTLAENWDLKFMGIYAGMFNDAAPAPYDSVNIGIIKPQIAWYAAKISETLYLSPELTYQLVAVNVGGETHSVALDLFLRTRDSEKPGSFALGAGVAYFNRTAEDDAPIDTSTGFDTGDGDRVATAITPEPGADGLLALLKLYWFW